MSDTAEVITDLTKDEMKRICEKWESVFDEDHDIYMNRALKETLFVHSAVPFYDIKEWSVRQYHHMQQ